MEQRKDKDNYYLDIADSVLMRATCLRRKYGAIIVQSDEIIATGYNGAPRGRKNCPDIGRCLRVALDVPNGERYELCRSVHAEANAIISAARRDMIGATLYLTGRDAKTNELLTDTTPCIMCRRMIINAGIMKTVCRTGESDYVVINTRDWVFNDDSLANY
ncbi:MAG: cytidine/deoxycytidylate deaminase family protein [Oscillospiraceae bacterium]|jgi:dCMP deaminase|nr:cytidine/deoxycytidylate deaminase family protein [Oscillospiraceae bacterium]